MQVLCVSDDPPVAILQIGVQNGVEMGRTFNIEDNELSPAMPLPTILNHTPYHDWRDPEGEEGEQILNLVANVTHGEPTQTSPE